MDDNRANAEESMIQQKDDDLQNAVDFSFNNPGIYEDKSLCIRIAFRFNQIM